MSALVLFPVVLSLLVLAAHFLRSGNVILVGAMFALLGMLAVRRPWAARSVQLALLLGAIEWVRTLIRLATLRNETGQPVLRLVLILGSVALITASSALVFRTRRLRARYDMSRTSGGAVARSDEPAQRERNDTQR